MRACEIPMVESKRSPKRSRALGLWVLNRFRVGYCPHPVTVYIRGPIKGYIYHIIIIIQLLLRAGSTQGFLDEFLKHS